MFRGIIAVHIDVKGRMAVPTRYRSELKKDNRPSVILTIDTEEKALLLYPIKTWEEIERQLAELPSFNVAARRIQRLLIGHATEAELDGQDRILLPSMLREYANITKQAVLVGQGKKFELWDKTTWELQRNIWLEEKTTTDAELPDEIKNISL